MSHCTCGSQSRSSNLYVTIIPYYLTRDMNFLPFASTWGHYRCLVGSVFLIFLVFYVVLVFVWLSSSCDLGSQCCLYLNCPFLIAVSVFERKCNTCVFNTVLGCFFVYGNDVKHNLFESSSPSKCHWNSFLKSFV